MKTKMAFVFRKIFLSSLLVIAMLITGVAVHAHGESLVAGAYAVVDAYDYNSSHLPFY